jgi:hypothetical protein
MAKKQGLNNLEIKMADMVPLTITFVDPEEKKGELAFVPVIYNPVSDTRPCYSVKKRSRPYIFKYYWEPYIKIFKEKANPIK